MCACSRIFPSDHDVLSIKSVNILGHRRLDYAGGLELEFREILVRLHLTEVLLNDGKHFVRVEVTAQTDRHIVRYIIGLVVVLDVCD